MNEGLTQEQLDFIEDVLDDLSISALNIKYFVLSGGIEMIGEILSTEDDMLIISSPIKITTTAETNDQGRIVHKCLYTNWSGCSDSDIIRLNSNSIIAEPSTPNDTTLFTYCNVLYEKYCMTDEYDVEFTLDDDIDLSHECDIKNPYVNTNIIPFLPHLRKNKNII